MLYKYNDNRRSTKENLHPLLDMTGNVMIKGENKADVLNAFFASFFLVFFFFFFQ